MRLTILSDSDMRFPYQSNEENLTRELTFSSSNIDKNIDSDVEPLAKLGRDYPANSMLECLNINSIKNKIVLLTDICQTSPIEILRRDETK